MIDDLTEAKRHTTRYEAGLQTEIDLIIKHDLQPFKRALNILTSYVDSM